MVCERGAELGIAVVPAVLMNQGRGPQDGAELDVRCSTWRFDNPQLEINAKGDLPEHYPGLTCLDFKHEEVRQERLTLIEETLNNYPVSGLEITLNCKHNQAVKRGVTAGGGNPCWPWAQMCRTTSTRTRSRRGGRS